MALLDTVLDFIGRRIAERLEVPASGYEPFSPSDPGKLARKRPMSSLLRGIRGLRPRSSI